MRTRIRKLLRESGEIDVGFDRIIKLNTTNEKGVVAKFPGQEGYYRRYGTNFTVVNSEGWIACDRLGNSWAFRRKIEAQEYSDTHVPEAWLKP